MRSRHSTQPIVPITNKPKVEGSGFKYYVRLLDSVFS
jgi:hypothetical protein